MQQMPPGPGAGPFQGAQVPYGAPDPNQAAIDAEHLRLLRIGYFIAAGQTAFFVPFGLLYAGMGFFMGGIPTHPGAAAPPVPVTWFFGIFGAVFAGFGLVATVARVLTAIRLKERRWRVFCMVTAGFVCFEAPYGTALGIMTIMALGRPSVRELFRD